MLFPTDERAIEVSGAGGHIVLMLWAITPSIELPAFDVASINARLARSWPDLSTEAARHVQERCARLGSGGEAWVEQGMILLAIEDRSPPPPPESARFASRKKTARSGKQPA
jgi:hypothetical protein